jgi:transposase
LRRQVESAAQTDYRDFQITDEECINDSSIQLTLLGMFDNLNKTILVGITHQSVNKSTNMKLESSMLVSSQMKRDGRTFDRKTLEEIRLMAVERVREGEPAAKVIEAYGFNRTTIYKWLNAALQPGLGIRALRSTKATGRPRTLTPRQEGQVFRWINGRDPRQYGLDFGLWTRAVVAELVEKKFGAKLGLTAVGELLARLGLTPQKPLQRAYQRDPDAIEKWQRETFPAIAKQAKAEGAEIFFWDESGFRADTVHGKTWGVRGQTPVVQRPGQRQSISAASAVNSNGAFWFCTYEGGLNAELFIELLDKMMEYRRKPIHLVLDSLPAHKTALVKKFVASSKGRLTLHFLPGYAPDLNPDELVWSHVKRTGTARRPLQKGEKLRDKIEGQLAKLQKLPELVRSFFKAPSVAYIGDY